MHLVHLYIYVSIYYMRCIPLLYVLYQDLHVFYEERLKCSIALSCGNGGVCSSSLASTFLYRYKIPLLVAALCLAPSVCAPVCAAEFVQLMSRPASSSPRKVFYNGMLATATPLLFYAYVSPQPVCAPPPPSPNFSLNLFSLMDVLYVRSNSQRWDASLSYCPMAPGNSPCTTAGDKRQDKCVFR